MLNLNAKKEPATNTILQNERNGKTIQKIVFCDRTIAGQKKKK